MRTLITQTWRQTHTDTQINTTVLLTWVLLSFQQAGASNYPCGLQVWALLLLILLLLPLKAFSHLSHLHLAVFPTNRAPNVWTSFCIAPTSTWSYLPQNPIKYFHSVRTLHLIIWYTLLEGNQNMRCSLEWVMNGCRCWEEVIELLCPLLVTMCKTYAIFKFVFLSLSNHTTIQSPIFWKKYCHLTNRSEECVDLLQQLIALLQFLSAVLQHGAGAVVFPQPLLVGFFLKVYIGKAKRPQSCKGAKIMKTINQ